MQMHFYTCIVMSYILCFLGDKPTSQEPGDRKGMLSSRKKQRRDEANKTDKTAGEFPHKCTDALAETISKTGLNTYIFFLIEVVQSSRSYLSFMLYFFVKLPIFGFSFIPTVTAQYHLTSL